jgi:hypothetical protein
MKFRSPSPILQVTVGLIFLFVGIVKAREAINVWSVGVGLIGVVLLTMVGVSVASVKRRQGQ